MRFTLIFCGRRDVWCLVLVCIDPLLRRDCATHERYIISNWRTDVCSLEQNIFARNLLLELDFALATVHLVRARGIAADHSVGVDQSSGVRAR